MTSSITSLVRKPWSTVMNRDDGKKQWAFKGKPLYFWSKDSKPGDGFNQVWQLARP